jgi:hypothetical protein
MRIEFWIFAGLFGAAILEGILSATWNRIYFSVGLPVFVTEVPVAHAPQATPTAAEIERLFKDGLLVPLTFHRGSANAVFFREKLIDFSVRLRYTPTMHGRLVFDHQKATVTVLGIANWFSLLFLGVAAFLAPRSPFMRAFALFAISLEVSIYALQFSRFRRVATSAAARWSEDTSTDLRGVS